MRRVSCRSLLAALFTIILTVSVISCRQTDHPRTKTQPHRRTSLGRGRRVVAIGDLHGDIQAARRALQLANVMSEENSWIGDSSRVVQLGDILDRGDHELEILELFAHLRHEAKQFGGTVVVLNGNHEIMNVELDFRYVTDAGFSRFAGFAVTDPLPEDFPSILDHQRGRAAAFRPGGPWAENLARHPVVAVVESTVFVHGGLIPEHARLGTQVINSRVREWMLGHADNAPLLIHGKNSPVWLRDLSTDPTEDDCRGLRETLRLLGAKRLVVAHTVQEHINCACDSLVWRVDTGMAAAYGGPIEVLEIAGSRIRILR